MLDVLVPRDITLRMATVFVLYIMKSTDFSIGCTRPNVVGIWSMCDVCVPTYLTIWHDSLISVKSAIVALMAFGTLSRAYGHSLTCSRLIYEIMCLLGAYLWHVTFPCCVCNWIVLWSQSEI